MSSPYVLYYSPATASMVVHVLLLQLNVPHELRLVDITKGEHRKPEYLRLNPNGFIAAIEIDGKVMYETSAISMYLAERHPEGNLAPAIGDPNRAAYLQWFFHFANTLQPAYRLWFFPTDIPNANEEDVTSVGHARVEKTWEILEQHLESAKTPFIAGDKLTAVDIYATMLVRWSRNMPKPATQLPRIAALVQRVTSLPSWKKMNEVEGNTDWL
ncbi:unnamed protein product [Aphanomyces euteiches]|uniref:Glutathione S-transferase n=1 Tax=Aphanomyces euteiches TaxID=100861 RepID=A0A6G0XTX2_9STRA|nr:hypothetical protein Ae201684_001628 [Aphanomyces euteiches]KAH9075520.1 hypothetical protein Ae201684P_004198 [Aphanomyces euteiches]KAH9133003.1 hypothetical protein AeRB84_020803 [Aphanomyces euteiches]